MFNYHSQWFQFPDSDSEWVLESKVTAATLVDKFWGDVGVRKEDFSGQHIECSPLFISEWHGIYIFNQFINKHAM
jgi:hypothetical protein